MADISPNREGGIAIPERAQKSNAVSKLQGRGGSEIQDLRSPQIPPFIGSGSELSSLLEMMGSERICSSCYQRKVQIPKILSLLLLW